MGSTKKNFPYVKTIFNCSVLTQGGNEAPQPLGAPISFALS
jgi:hypothetical protein